ncbi:tyrosine-type recombinase/integrase [Promicromonospora sp. NPDC090134]|uniref:tyrosine-type recombinase/integrase n=1 Tax=Promicromonospora sp. NPDC090134 TaxID=3364408 RepID=UPI0037F80718
MTSALEEQLDDGAQPGPDGLVFPSTMGTPISQSTFWEAWNKARKAIGRPGLQLHDLRTTAATLAAGTGATIAELMARLGHTTPNAAMCYQTAVHGA